MKYNEILNHLSDLFETSVPKSSIIFNGGLICTMTIRNDINSALNIISKSNILVISDVYISDTVCYIYLVVLTNLKNIDI